ncbi:MAG: hypothetical protein P8X62_11635 [Flavobacteriaceae bacterium]
MIKFFRKIRQQLKSENRISKYFPYAIHMFFIEVVYDVEHNVITEVRSFKYGHSLDKYSNIHQLK